MPVPPGLHIGQRFQTGRGGDQRNGKARQPRPHHRHIPRAVDHAFFLFEERFMLFIHNNQAEVFKRQEQGGARTHNHRRGAVCRSMPCQAAGALADFGMPDGGLCAKATGKALHPLGGERNFRQQDQRLFALFQTGGNSFQINLGLAGASDTFQQRDGESPFRHGLAQGGCGLGLCAFQHGQVMERVRGGKGAFRPKRHRGQSACICQTFHNAGANACGCGKVCGGAGRAIGQQGQHFLAGRGQPQPVRRGGCRQPARGGRWHAAHMQPQCHGQHHAGGGKGIGGNPVHKAPQLRCQRWQVKPFRHRAQLGGIHRAGRRWRKFWWQGGGCIPHHAGLPAVAEGHCYNITGQERHVCRGSIIKRAGERHGQQHGHSLARNPRTRSWRPGRLGVRGRSRRHNGLCKRRPG